MEEVIQVLVFIVIVTSVLISKYKEVKTNRPGQPTQHPVKENYEELPDEEDVVLFEETEVCPPSFIQDTPKHPFEQPEKHVNETSITSHTDILPKKKHKIRFKSRKEARQAFIYSEIFNRKYE